MIGYEPYDCGKCGKQVTPQRPMNRVFPRLPVKYHQDPEKFCVADVISEMIAKSKFPPNRGAIFVRHRPPVCKACNQGFCFYWRKDGKWFANKDVNPRSWTKSDPGFVGNYSTSQLAGIIKEHQDKGQITHVTLEWGIRGKPVRKKWTHVYAAASPRDVALSASVDSPRVISQRTFTEKAFDWLLRRKSSSWTTVDTASTGQYVCLSRGVDPEYEERGYSGTYQVELDNLLSNVSAWTDGIISESPESVNFRAKIRKMHGYKKLWDDKA
jgi:hypothetical protein